MIECSAQGKSCNRGRSEAINLIQACPLEYKSDQPQCSDAAVKVAGGLFENSLNIESVHCSLELFVCLV